MLPTRLYTNYLEYVTKGHINAYNIVLNLNGSILWFLNGTTVLNNILLLITVAVNL